MNQSIEARVIEIVQKITKDSSITRLTSQNEVVSWDSLAYLVIVAEVENEFGIVVSTENIDSFDSVENIIELILNARGDADV